MTKKGLNCICMYIYRHFTCCHNYILYSKPLQLLFPLLTVVIVCCLCLLLQIQRNFLFLSVLFSSLFTTIMCCIFGTNFSTRNLKLTAFLCYFWYTVYCEAQLKIGFLETKLNADMTYNIIICVCIKFQPVRGGQNSAAKGMIVEKAAGRI